MKGRKNLRLYIFRAAIVVAFCGLVVRLWQLQVVGIEKYRLKADRNRFRLVTIDAPRGVIYDRYGQVLVRNIPSFTVSIVPASLPQDEQRKWAVLSRVGNLLGIPVTNGGIEVKAKPGLSAPNPSSVASLEEIMEELENRLKEGKASPYTPVPIKEQVDRQIAFLIEEQHLDLPGIIVQTEPLRQYIYGALTSHLLGYVGRIPRERVEKYLAQPDSDYTPNDNVGLAGVELEYESDLRGRKGRKHVEVDVYGREVSVLAIDPPTPGCNLVLSIDLELQRAVEVALRRGMRKVGSRSGVAIAMDPRSGEVLALVSLPSYDDNLFTGGISQEDFNRLLDDPLHPLVNHAIGGLYPPGSTFKPVVAVGALQEHVATTDTELTCEGELLLPNKYFPDDPEKAQVFKCWRKQGHGTINLIEAIQHSCDIYFYQLAGGYEEFHGLGMEKVAQYAHLFGYGDLTGIDLPGESKGLVPTDRWKRQNYGESWVTGDTYNAAIGQGFVLATPLQVLNATAAIANFGTLYRPHVGYKIVDQEGHTIRTIVPEVIREIPVNREYLAAIREGMRRAVTHGTAWLLHIPEVPVAGKTGTAEYPAVDENGNLILDEQGNLPTHAWFTAFAPFDDPEIALVVFVEGGGEGSQVAVPIAEEILRYYFGLPEIQPTPTPDLPAEPTG